MSKLSSPPPTEPAFLDCILLLDTKNYHVWTYRQWLVRHFSLWDSPSEFSSVESFLTRDVRNNSAWNHRWFLCFGRDETSSIPKSGGEEEEEEEASTTTTQIIDLDILDREIAYTSNKIHLAPQNPSPWSYLRALLEKSSSVGSTTQSDLQPFAEQYAGMLPPDNQIPETPDKSPDSNIRTTPRENVKSTHALSFLADCYLEQGKIQEAKDIWIIDLAGKWDRIRKGFWAYRAAQV
ncbi:putative farnesyltransferase alpha subunit [Phaeomoniella chlamydospora]|uniref:Protein farnesyltransferase/geranylgeranyltransferase type-1 subunit alpha n=1 Tax=Phaeomoniella chlamydospora TaxID=158046 RepID=A0A0G2F458_PHACM|nr:putative farnesyltransferase alpha subunit [Phaeomoniella chlamydospora]